MVGYDIYWVSTSNVEHMAIYDIYWASTSSVEHLAVNDIYFKGFLMAWRLMYLKHKKPPNCHNCFQLAIIFVQVFIIWRRVRPV